MDKENDKHDLVSNLLTLTQELGQTPTRAQFITHVRGGAYRIDTLFGSYTKLVKAAGLVPYNERRITSAIFEKNISNHFDNYKPTQIEIERKPYSSIITISDIHWPFCNEIVITRFLEAVGDIKPEFVILNGDAWDMYSHTKFPRSHNVFTPREEEKLARQKNIEFWQNVIALSPKSQMIQMMGNHDVRPMKRVLEAYPEAEDWIKEKLSQLFTFEGVRTILDQREELILGDIAIFHGYRSQLGAHRDYTLFNTINGHTHKGGTVFRRIRGQTLWELNSGFAGDPEGKGLTYTPQKITDWTPGFGMVDKFGPRFVPL